MWVWKENELIHKYNVIQEMHVPLQSYQTATAIYRSLFEFDIWLNIIYITLSKTVTLE